MKHKLSLLNSALCIVHFLSRPVGSALRLPLLFVLMLGVGNVWGKAGDILYETDSFPKLDAFSYTQNKTFTLGGKTWKASVAQQASSVFYLGCNSGNASKGILNDNSDFAAVVTALKSASEYYNTNYTKAHAYALLFDNSYSKVGSVKISWSGANNAGFVYIFGDTTGTGAFSLLQKESVTSGATTAGSAEFTTTKVGGLTISKLAFVYRPGASESAGATNKTFRVSSVVIKEGNASTSGEYSLSYVLDGGTAGSAQPSKGTIGTAFAVSAPAKDNNTFTGWSVTSGLASTAKWGTTSTPSTSIADASTLCVNGTNDVYFLDLGADKAEVTLTANWESTGPSCTSITPLISYSTASVKEGLASVAPTISGNTGSGAVTYSIISGSEYADINASSGVLTAKTAGEGSVVVQASITASGEYCQATCSTTVSVVAATISASSNNTELGTVQISGKVITASPKSCVGYANTAYTVTSGSAEVAQDGNTFTVTPSGDCSVQINFATLSVDTYTDNLHGQSTSKCGNNYTIPSLEDATKGSGCDGEHYKFIGWSTSSYSQGKTSTSDVPGFFEATGTKNATGATYYAVWAKEKEAE